MPGVGIVRIDSTRRRPAVGVPQRARPATAHAAGAVRCGRTSGGDELLASGLETRALLVTEPALASLESLLTDLSVPIYVVPQSVMNGVAGFNFHRGCLAIGVRPPARDWREIVRSRPGTGGAYSQRDSSSSSAWATWTTLARSSATPPRSVWTACCSGRLRRPALPQGHPHVDGRIADDALRDGAVAGRAGGTWRAADGRRSR